jgi:anti-sigma factor RsiW
VTGPDHERYGDDVGAYLLGALSEVEARAYERHTAVCPECRDELDRLRPAAAAIARSPEQFEPPGALRKSLMATVKAESRERGSRRASFRWLPRARLAWAATALVLIGAALGVGLGLGTRGGSSERVVAALVRGLPGGSASLVVRKGQAGLLRVSGMPVLRDGRVYEVWIQRGGAVRPAGALFEVGSDGRGAAAVPGAAAGDRVLVTRERAGGVSRPTEKPVIAAQV